MLWSETLRNSNKWNKLKLLSKMTWIRQTVWTPSRFKFQCISLTFIFQIVRNSGNMYRFVLGKHRLSRYIIIPHSYTFTYWTTRDRVTILVTSSQVLETDDWYFLSEEKKKNRTYYVTSSNRVGPVYKHTRIHVEICEKIY